jgi:hypothetical protein
MIVAFLESELKQANEVEAITGMDLYFIRSGASGVTRIYYKFFNDLDSAVDFFYVKKKLRIVNVSGYSNCLMKFGFYLKFITVYNIETVFRTIQSYELLEK